MPRSVSATAARRGFDDGTHSDVARDRCGGRRCFGGRTRRRRGGRRRDRIRRLRPVSGGLQLRTGGSWTRGGRPRRRHDSSGRRTGTRARSRGRGREPRRRSRGGTRRRGRGGRGGRGGTRRRPCRERSHRGAGRRGRRGTARGRHGAHPGRRRRHRGRAHRRHRRRSHRRQERRGRHRRGGSGDGHRTCARGRRRPRSGLHHHRRDDEPAGRRKRHHDKRFRGSGTVGPRAPDAAAVTVRVRAAASPGGQGVRVGRVRHPRRRHEVHHRPTATPARQHRHRPHVDSGDRRRPPRERRLVLPRHGRTAHADHLPAARFPRQRHDVQPHRRLPGRAHQQCGRRADSDLEPVSGRRLLARGRPDVPRRRRTVHRRPRGAQRERGRRGLRHPLRRHRHPAQRLRPGRPLPRRRPGRRCLRPLRPIRHRQWRIQPPRRCHLARRCPAAQRHRGELTGGARRDRHLHSVPRAARADQPFQLHQQHHPGAERGPRRQVPRCRTRRRRAHGLDAGRQPRHPAVRLCGRRVPEAPESARRTTTDGGLDQRHVRRPDRRRHRGLRRCRVHRHLRGTRVAGRDPDRQGPRHRQGPRQRGRDLAADAHPGLAVAVDPRGAPTGGLNPSARMGRRGSRSRCPDTSRV
uniref:LigA n=1 Tax=Mycobacterium sp. (strain MCS) TaxID=164756 RepID=A0A5Q5BPA1_MYCSS